MQQASNKCLPKASTTATTTTAATTSPNTTPTNNSLKLLQPQASGASLLSVCASSTEPAAALTAHPNASQISSIPKLLHQQQSATSSSCLASQSLSGCNGASKNYATREEETQEMVNKTRKLQLEVEEKNEIIFVLREELEAIKESADKFQAENCELRKDSLKAKLLQDENDFLTDKVAKCERLEAEITKLKEKLIDVDYLNERIKEVADDKHKAYEEASKLESKLEETELRLAQIKDLDAELNKWKNSYYHLEADKSSLQQKFLDLVEQETNSNIQKKQLEDEIKRLQLLVKSYEACQEEEQVSLVMSSVAEIEQNDLSLNNARQKSAPRSTSNTSTVELLHQYCQTDDNNNDNHEANENHQKQLHLQLQQQHEKQQQLLQQQLNETLHRHKTEQESLELRADALLAEKNGVVRVAAENEAKLMKLSEENKEMKVELCNNKKVISELRQDLICERNMAQKLSEQMTKFTEKIKNLDKNYLSLSTPNGDLNSLNNNNISKNEVTDINKQSVFESRVAKTEEVEVSGKIVSVNDSINVDDKNQQASANFKTREQDNAKANRIEKVEELDGEEEEEENDDQSEAQDLMPSISDIKPVNKQRFVRNAAASRSVNFGQLSRVPQFNLPAGDANAFSDCQQSVQPFYDDSRVQTHSNSSSALSHQHLLASQGHQHLHSNSLSAEQSAQLNHQLVSYHRHQQYHLYMQQLQLHYHHHHHQHLRQLQQQHMELHKQQQQHQQQQQRQQQLLPQPNSCRSSSRNASSNVSGNKKNLQQQNNGKAQTTNKDLHTNKLVNSKSFTNSDLLSYQSALAAQQLSSHVANNGKHLRTNAAPAMQPQIVNRFEQTQLDTIGLPQVYSQQQIKQTTNKVPILQQQQQVIAGHAKRAIIFEQPMTQLQHRQVQHAKQKHNSSEQKPSLASSLSTSSSSSSASSSSSTSPTASSRETNSQSGAEFARHSSNLSPSSSSNCSLGSISNVPQMNRFSNLRHTTTALPTGARQFSVERDLVSPSNATLTRVGSCRVKSSQGAHKQLQKFVAASVEPPKHYATLLELDNCDNYVNTRHGSLANKKEALVNQPSQTTSVRRVEKGATSEVLQAGKQKVAANRSSTDASNCSESRLTSSGAWFEYGCM